MSVFIINRNTTIEQINNKITKRNIDIRDKYGITYIHYSCSNGLYEITKFLIEKGVKLNI